MRFEKHKVSKKKVHVTSEFVTKTLQKALPEKQKALKKAYTAANRDLDREEVLDDWSVLDLT